MTERPSSPPNRSRESQHDAQRIATRKATAREPNPTSDALAALERARRHAFEAQEAERWDGLS